MQPLSPAPSVVRVALRAALALFVVAGLTGAVFRFAVAHALGPAQLGGLLLGNVRHAHSHLMYFGWATPALMVLIAAARRQRGDGPMPGLRGVLAVTFAMAVLAFPPFLLWGYGLAPVGEARIPLAMIAASLNVLGWYAFAVAYLRTPRAGPDPVRRVFSLAVGFLVLSTLGAWGVAGLPPPGLANPARTATLVHVFLDTFSEGWFVLGVLGLAFAAASQGGRPLPMRAVGAVALGVPLVFPLALPSAYVPTALRVAAGLGGVLVGGGLLLCVAWLWQRISGAWRFALACLAVKAVGQLAVALVPGVDWAALHGLRILYLHLMLLGFVSVGLVAASGAPTRAFTAAVAVLLASLILLTPLWPSLLAGDWVYHGVAWGTLPAIVVAAGIGLSPWRRTSAGLAGTVERVAAPGPVEEVVG
jgi:hypothetical protein